VFSDFDVVFRLFLSLGVHDVMQTGRDGCICKFVVDTITIIDEGQPSGQGFACTGVEDVAAITVVESVEYRLDKRKCRQRLAAGFIASNFVLWDLTQQSEVDTFIFVIYCILILLSLPKFKKQLLFIAINAVTNGSRNLYLAAYASDVWRMAKATFIFGWRYSRASVLFCFPEGQYLHFQLELL